MSSAARRAPWWIRGAQVQSRTVGALIMRELHTRFGRDNIGYLWLFLEPGLLAMGIAAVHALGRWHALPWGMDVVSFYVSGYTAYAAFRGAVGRASTTLSANGSLLYHRGITITDMVIARTLLDTIAPLVAGVLIMAVCAAMGFSTIPDRPLLFLGAWALMLWFCFGLAMLALAGNVAFPTLERLIPPFTYLMLPLSNVFTIFEMIPAYAQPVMLLIPIAHINEMVREGVYGDFNSALVDPIYVVCWCLALTILGVLAVAAARPKVTFE